MGQPVRIVDLALDLIRLSSPHGGRDIEIAFTGLRPGEKLEETLFASDEDADETMYPFLSIARAKQTGTAELPQIEELESAAAEGDDAAARKLLLPFKATAA
jgi:FlaA1/EpsC-like NDP-sugar epimerase